MPDPKIDKGCAGCERLWNSNDPLCHSCYKHNNYHSVNSGRYDVELEMRLLEKSNRDRKKVHDDWIDALIWRKDNPYLRKEKIDYMSFYGYRDPADNIEKVIFNDPATIIVWKDGSKTVVKANGEDYDPEKGFAMALAKKYLGDKGNYYNVFKKWVPEEFTKPKKVEEVSVDRAIALVDKILAKDPCVSVDCDAEECEVLPYGCNKSECHGKCKDCCPVDTNNKRKAGKVCKEGCPVYNVTFK